MAHLPVERIRSRDGQSLNQVKTNRVTEFVRKGTVRREGSVASECESAVPGAPVRKDAARRGQSGQCDFLRENWYNPRRELIGFENSRDA